MPTPAQTAQRKSLFGALENFAQEITQVKTAGHNKAAGPTPADPGGYQGATTHPTKDVDNNVQNATEGSRSSENTSDVKKQQGAPSVDSTSEKSQEGRQDEVQLNIGLNASAVGEDSSVEDDYKPGKDDPGSTHPARTDNDSLDGQKYASSSFDELLKMSSEKGNALLADLAVGLGNSIAPGKPGAKTPTKQAAAPAAPVALTAGYELAEALGLSKEAAAAQVQDIIAQTIVDAQTDADLFAGAYKQAADEDEAQGGEDHSSPEDVGSGAGAGSPADGGGAPPAPAAGGGGGAPPPGGAHGAGGPSEEEALQELGMALHEMGMTPQDLLAMLQGGGAGGAGGGGAPPPGGDPMGGGGAPPPGGDPMGGMGGGGAPPPGGDPMAAMGGGGGAPPMDPMMGKAGQEIAKLATAAHRFMRSGRFQIKASETPRSRGLRDNIKSHLQELILTVR